MPAALDPALDRDAVNVIRGLAMDAPLKAKSGHQGTAMALAPLAHVLYSRIMKFDPADPAWPDRDRFILSNGHASILQYSMLYLAGLGLELEDLQEFRQWESRTPGHPEVGHTAGVEVTTGPLGQGFANSVGMAIAEANLRARFGAELSDHHVFVIAGDGCFMEGVSHEAASLAGHLGLGRLVCVYDDNKITIDGSTSLTYSDDVPKRFEAYGWHVEVLGEVAEDLDALEAGIRRAMAVEDRPSLLVVRSHIGFPSPDLTDRHEAHGNPFTAEKISATKAVMGIPDEPFWSPDGLVSAYRSHCATRGADAHAAWSERLTASAKRSEWNAVWAPEPPAGWADALPSFAADDASATRQAVQKVFVAAAEALPGLVSGAADLTGNTGTALKGQQAFSSEDPSGRQLYFGVREHGMGSAMVGMALHGGLIPIGGTFFVFFDYMKPAVRLAALSRARCIFVFSHDSVGVGEDGPTHQPIEHLAALRAIPGLQVIRPADGNETREAVRAAIEHHGPTALVLTRQSVPACTDGSAVTTGAAVVRPASGAPTVVLAATGSEVHVAVAAAERLAASGVDAAVVSMPSWDRFDAQPAPYRASVFPDGVPVLSIEAAATFGWHKYADACIGIDRFGASAPGDLVLDRLGINVDHVVERATALIEGKDAR